MIKSYQEAWLGLCEMHHCGKKLLVSAIHIRYHRRCEQGATDSVHPQIEVPHLRPSPALFFFPLCFFSFQLSKSWRSHCTKEGVLISFTIQERFWGGGRTCPQSFSFVN